MVQFARSIACAFLLATSALAAAVPITNTPTRTLTNAERIQKGLPLSKPKRMFNGNRRQGAGPPDPDPSAGATISGIIQVDNAAGDFIGYVSITADSNHLYALTNNFQGAVQVSIVISATPGNLNAVVGGIDGLPYIGGIASDGDLSSTTANYALIGGVSAATDAGSGPETGVLNTFDGHTSGSETPMWVVGDFGSITPVWTNTGGDTVTPTLAYRGGTGDLFFITGDLDAYNTQLGDPNSAHGDQVSWHIVAIPT